MTDAELKALREKNWGIRNTPRGKLVLSLIDALATARAELEREQHADYLRGIEHGHAVARLAPLEPGLVAVSREVVDQAKAALVHAHTHRAWVQLEIVEAALAALEACK